MKKDNIHYDIKEYNYNAVLRAVQTLDAYNRYDVAVYIYENNGDVVRDFKRLKEIKKRYKKIKIKIIYSSDYIKENRKKQIVMNLLFILMIIIIIFVIFYLASFWFSQKSTEKLSKKIIKYKPKIEIKLDNVDSTKKVETTPYNKKYSKMFNELKQINSETVGWLTVNGTNIDYPVVQHSDNDYYLSHDFENNSNRYGWVFMDYRNNAATLGKNTIIYGHDSAKVMFARLYRTLNKSWYTNKTNQVITFNTINEASNWQIFSIYTIDTTSDYLKTTFTEQEFLDFVNVLKSRSIYDFKVDVGANDKILTLSTCYGNTQRLVVHAKKLN